MRDRQSYQNIRNLFDENVFWSKGVTMLILMKQESIHSSKQQIQT